MTWEEQAATFGTADIVARLAGNANRKRQLEWFQRQLFGRTSEKRLREPDPTQLSRAGMLTTPVAPVDPPPPPAEAVNASQRRLQFTGTDRAEESERRFTDAVPVQESRLTNPAVGALPPDAYEGIGEQVT